MKSKPSYHNELRDNGEAGWCGPKTPYARHWPSRQGLYRKRKKIDLLRSFNSLENDKNWFNFPSHGLYHSFWACKNISSRFEMFLCIFWFRISTFLPLLHWLLFWSAASRAQQASTHQARSQTLSLQAPKTLRALLQHHLTWLGLEQKTFPFFPRDCSATPPTKHCTLHIRQNTPLIISSPGPNFSLWWYGGRGKEGVTYINRVTFRGRYLAFISISLG